MITLSKQTRYLLYDINFVLKNFIFDSWTLSCSETQIKKIGFYKTQQGLRRYRVFSVWCKLCFFVNLIDLFKQVFHKTFKDVSISIISKITSEKHAFYFASLQCLSKSSRFYAKKDFPKMYSINVSAWANFWNSIYWR